MLIKIGWQSHNRCTSLLQTIWNRSLSTSSRRPPGSTSGKGTGTGYISFRAQAGDRGSESTSWTSNTLVIKLLMVTTRGGEQVGLCKLSRSWRGLAYPFLPHRFPDPFWKQWFFFLLHFSAPCWVRCTVLNWLAGFTLLEHFCLCGAVDTTNENIVTLLCPAQISTCSFPTKILSLRPSLSIHTYTQLT